jgi:hypothetical protein
VLPYEESIRVPLMMRGPGVPRGVALPQLVANIDIAPTLLEAAGAQANGAIDGLSLFPYLRDPGLETGRDILIEAPLRRLRLRASQRFSGLRTVRHLYIEHDTGERELYDLARDPGQVNSLHADPTTLPLQTALHRRLERLRNCAGSGCRPPPNLRLAVRLQGFAVSSKRQCVRSVLVRVAGRASTRVASVRYTVDGLPVGSVRRPPFSRLISGDDLDADGALVRARITLRDDRVVTLDEQVPACG